MKMWFVRLLNRLGLRRDRLLCMRKEDTWCWPERLGARTEGKCERCGSTVYYERQNRPFVKICNRCGVST